MRQFLLLFLVASPAWSHKEEKHHKALKNTNSEVDEWVLLGHGSERSLYADESEKMEKSEWKSSFDFDDFHFPDWAVPFGEGPVQSGGVAQRKEDGHIHLPLLGNVRHGGGPEWPAGGATKAWAPPVIWEIDGVTGKTVRVYNLSSVAAGFESVLRYTSDGYPVVALYGGQGGQKIVVLDRNSDQVLSSFGPGVEPMLLAFAKTDPPQLIWASLSANGGINFNGHEPQPNTHISTGALSTIVFGADGKTIYNNGFFNEATGIYRFSLPLSGHTERNLFISGCYTKPWIMVADKAGNNYALCQSGGSFHGWSESGAHLWSAGGSASWLIMTDDESTLLAGSGNSYRAIDPKTGSSLWSTTAAQAFGNGTSCQSSAQPWAPRHPVPLPSKTIKGGYLAVLCTADGSHAVRVLNVNDGSAVKGAVAELDFAPSMITIDASNYVYAYGSEDSRISVQRKLITGL